MKKFVELIQRVYQERYSAVIHKIWGKKIPVTFLTVGTIQNVISNVKNLCEQGLNITNLVYPYPPPVRNGVRTRF